MTDQAPDRESVDRDEDWWDEPIGSCDRCGCNLYEEDDDCLCAQCEWAILESETPQ